MAQRRLPEGRRIAEYALLHRAPSGANAGCRLSVLSHHGLPVFAVFPGELRVAPREPVGAEHHGWVAPRFGPVRRGELPEPGCSRSGSWSRAIFVGQLKQARNGALFELEQPPLLPLSDWPAVPRCWWAQPRVRAVSAVVPLPADRSRRSRCDGGLRRTAVVWQPDRNQGGLCSFCAADRRPPEPKDHSHEDAGKADDRSRRSGAGADRLRHGGRASQRDAPRPCESAFTAARSAGGVVGV